MIVNGEMKWSRNFPTICQVGLRKKKNNTSVCTADSELRFKLDNFWMNYFAYQCKIIYMMIQKMLLDWTVTSNVNINDNVLIVTVVLDYNLFHHNLTLPLISSTAPCGQIKFSYLFLDQSLWNSNGYLGMFPNSLSFVCHLQSNEKNYCILL
jgi:hypothetical protein